MCTFIENYLHFMKNCMRPPYEKLKSLKSGFIENSNFQNNRDHCPHSYQTHTSPVDVTSPFFANPTCQNKPTLTSRQLSASLLIEQ